jgi:hypothetical protein
MRKLEDWIDYLEDECPPKRCVQLNMLLKFSVADRLILDNLRRLRQLIKLCDPADAIEGVLCQKEFLQDSHSQIMAGIMSPSGRRPDDVVSQERDLSPFPETCKR